MGVDLAKHSLVISPLPSHHHYLVPNTLIYMNRHNLGTLLHNEFSEMWKLGFSPEVLGLISDQKEKQVPKQQCDETNDPVGI